MIGTRNHIKLDCCPTPCKGVMFQSFLLERMQSNYLGMIPALENKYVLHCVFCSVVQVMAHLQGRGPKSVDN